MPTASERGGKSELAHKWARWLHNPCRLGFPTASERGAKSELAHKWARWLHNPYRLGGPHCFRAEAKSEAAHKWARWLHDSCPGGPHRFRAGGKIRGGRQVGNVAKQPLPPRGSPTASERGAKSEVAHKWARWLHNPCRLGGPHSFGAGRKIKGGRQVGNVAKQPQPPRGAPLLQSGGQSRRWPRSGQGGYITPAA